MAQAGQNYRKKQAFLVILVFICIAVAFWAGSAPVAVGMVLVASVICFWAATMEPEKANEKHHHH